MGWNGGKRSVGILNLDFSGDQSPGADLGRGWVQETTSYQSLKLSGSMISITSVCLYLNALGIKEMLI